jgi:hypothetical protein
VRSRTDKLALARHGLAADSSPAPRAGSASATSIDFFSRVDIGPYEERARQMILDATPGTPTDFSTIIVRWVAQPHHEGVAQTQFSPYKARLEGVNEVKLFLGGVIIHVKVDQRPYPVPFPELLLRPGGSLFLIAREFAGSKDVTQSPRPF